MKTFRVLLLGSLIAITATLTGCGHVAVFGHTIGESSASTSPSSSNAAPNTAPAESEKSNPAVPEMQKIKGVVIVLSKETAAKVAADSRFSAEVLLEEIKTELKSRNVLHESDSQVTSVLEIVIGEYALQPASNAILFGQIIHSGKLYGALRVRDAKGNEWNRHIEARARVSIAEKGETKNPLAPLYREFAVVTGNTLTGVTLKDVDSENWRPR
jgi:hypothetical protein